jgi:hypothetical protein
MNKVTLPKEKYISNAKSYDGDKEPVYRLVALDADTGKNLVDIRAWVSRGNRFGPVYASVWVMNTDAELWLSGKGRATGGNYNKRGAAIDSAIRDAGIHCGVPIEAYGVKVAALEICKALGYPNVYIVE